MDIKSIGKPNSLMTYGADSRRRYWGLPQCPGHDQGSSLSPLLPPLKCPLREKDVSQSYPNVLYTSPGASIDSPSRRSVCLVTHVSGTPVYSLVGLGTRVVQTVPDLCRSILVSSHPDTVHWYSSLSPKTVNGRYSSDPYRVRTVES